MKRAFTNATIIPGEDEALNSATLIIEEDKIMQIGIGIDTSGCEIIDCTGNYITPGFIDAHTHVGMYEQASREDITYDWNETIEAVVPQLKSMDSIFPEEQSFEDARRGGVTTLGITHGSANPIGGQLCVVKAYGDIVDKMVIKEPAGLKFAMGENPRRTGMSNKRSPHTRMAVASLIRKSFHEATDYQKEWEEFMDKKNREELKEDAEQVYVKPPKYDMGKEILLKVLNREIPVRNHCHRADDIATAIRLSEEFGYKLVLDHATESYKIKEFVVEKKIPVVIGPLFGVPTKREARDKSMHTPGIMMQAGAMVCITTDAPVVPIDGLRDTLIMAIRAGLPEDRALETITINPARVLELDDRVGSLKAGKDADFLIFNGNPLDGRNKVMQTYIDGKCVYSEKDE
ncbi:MAG: amidohydrolase [Candidatus Kariarchaeaceae archaeon]|jgi:imidazolonepropionase-like amidohydrolase